MRAGEVEPLGTVANVITVARTLAGVGLGIAALAAGSWHLLIAAYACYWIGDICDGIAARRLGQETIFGAVFDVVCDRACTTVAAAAFVALEPHAAWPIALFLIQFCMLDTMLTLAFLYYPGVISPNYFARVDRPIYQWNWSPLAKAANTSVVVLLCLVGAIVPAFLWAAAMTVVKVISLHRLYAIRHGRVEARPSSTRASAP